MKENCTTIELTQGQEAIIDSDDYKWLNQSKWYASYNLCTKGYYARRNIAAKSGQKTIRMHRVIVERHLGRKLKQGEQVDHKNHNTLDNRKDNLRACSSRQNTQNRKGKIFPPGVTWHKRDKKFRVDIRIEKKVKSFFYYPDPLSAAIIYEFVNREVNGEELICKANI